MLVLFIYIKQKSISILIILCRIHIQIIKILGSRCLFSVPWLFFLIFLFGGRANLSTYSGMLGLRKSFIIKQWKYPIKPYENLTSLIHNICLSGSCRVMGTRRIHCKDWIKEGEVCKKHNCCYDNFFKMCYHKKEGMWIMVT